jgi:hypothetical protein
MPESPILDELEALYASLSPGERDELLQCLLIAASISGEMVVERLGAWLLAHASRQLIGEVTETGVDPAKALGKSGMIGMMGAVMGD